MAGAPAWQQNFIRTSDLTTSEARSSFYARVKAGRYVALFRGIYLPTDMWLGLDTDSNYRARVKAAAYALGPATVFSHHSAAALWQLPWVGEPWPGKVHVVAPHSKGGRSNRSTVYHTVGIPSDTVLIHGVRVTTLARTVVDLSTSAAFGAAVTLADAALRRTSHPLPQISGVPVSNLRREDIYLELDAMSQRRGPSQARRVAEFASGAADRPGESLSRVSMLLAGISPPVLQQQLRGASGKKYTVDFWWPQYNVIGEFDGKVKYTDPKMLGYAAANDAVYKEKLREDDLRAAGHGMTRWPWGTANSPSALRTHLHRAGVR